MNIDLLLSEVTQISKKYELINQRTGGYFNIFDIANISHDEVCICRFIYELINPKGSHYQGDLYLRFFVENVLNMKLSESEYKSAVVHREYVLANSRRIDLVIETKDKFIPIEVKIYAGDQQNQCSDYYKYAKNSNVFYLTLHGVCPSEYSAKNLTKIKDGKDIVGYKEVTQISFETEILNWLSECLSHQETIKIAPIREVILQFMGVIRRMTNLLVEEKEDEIVNAISSSKENIKSAIEIEKSLKSCKIQMIRKVLEAIEERLDNKFKNEDKIEHYSYTNDNYKNVNTYYNKKSSTYPGFSYFIKSLDKKGVDLLLRIEIDNCLFVGFCTPHKNKFDGKQLNQDEINILLHEHNPCSVGWWIYWEYLPYDNEFVSPDFKSFNEAYFDLFDENKFNNFIDLCEDNICKMLEKLR